MMLFAKIAVYLCINMNFFKGIFVSKFQKHNIYPFVSAD